MSQYRIASGHITLNALTSDPTTIIERWSPVGGRQWFGPDNDADMFDAYALVDKSISGRGYRYGLPEIRWAWRMLHPLQVKYLRDTFFGDNEWALVTIYTYNRRTGAWEAYQCEAHWPSVKDAELGGGGYDRFMMLFLHCVPAPDGVELSFTIDHPPTEYTV